MDSPSSLDVVVLNWRDAPATRACVQSLLAQSGIRAIYVVDNESAGELADQQRSGHPTVVVLPTRENRGFSGGVNVAFCHRRHHGSSGPVLVINNDVLMPPGSVESLLKAHETFPNAIVGPKLVFPSGIVQALGYRVSRLSGIARANTTPGRRVDYLTWACVLVPHPILQRLEGLDESFFMYWEDAEFSARALDAGFSLHVDESTTVVHELSASAATAGNKLAEYYTWGLHVFGRRRHGLARVRTYIGLFLLVSKRLAVKDLAGAKAQWKGWRRRSGTPAHLDL